MSEVDVVDVVGIGADGWAGLTGAARAALRQAEVVLGSARQLALLSNVDSGELVAWPSPMLPALPGLLRTHAGRRVCVLASGDPMFHGVGSTLVRLLGADRVRVLPHPSSVSLACARLGWALDEVEVVSLVGRAVESLHRHVHDGRRLLVLSADGGTPRTVAALLAGCGFADSEITVLESLGGPDERVAGLGDHSGPFGALNIVAVRCRGESDGLPLVPGLADGAYEHDGQLTKREVRAIALARLAPVPGQLLWDVGAGAGSIAIEWMRSHRSCRAVAIERDPARAERIGRNAAKLGVPALRVVVGTAPEALTALTEPSGRDAPTGPAAVGPEVLTAPEALTAPDAVFVGGGATAPGLLAACWEALRPRGRLVVNAVTLESERAVADAYARYGGDLTRIAINRAAPVGGYTGWRAMLPITMWTVVKP